MRASSGRSVVTMSSWSARSCTAASSPEAAVNSVKPTRSVKTIAPVTDAIRPRSRRGADRDAATDRATRDTAVVARRGVALALPADGLHRDAGPHALGQRHLHAPGDGLGEHVG